MKPALNQGYIMGLLADAERRVGELDATLTQGRIRGAAVEAELTATLTRFDQVRQAVAKRKEAVSQAAQIISDNNGKLTTAHRDVGALQRRSDELLEVMRAAADPEEQRRVRRRRAQVLVDIQDQQKKLTHLQGVIDDARKAMAMAQQEGTQDNDRERLLVKELDLLQAQLPDPALYLQQFAAHAGLAHCVLFLDHRRAAWVEEMEKALQAVWELHTSLRSGRYRLDTQSELIGGRAQETAEALYACVAMGNRRAAREMFALVTDPNLFFHHIFHVFRVWCLGLYLNQNTAELAALVQLHLYADGLRGAYAQAFAGILQRDARAFAMAVRSLVQQEWQAALKSQNRALGVVNVNAVALCRMAARARMPLPELGPTVPNELLEIAPAAGRKRAK